MAFGDRIKARREELALSRPQLADRLGVTPSTVSNYETGVSFPKEEMMLRLFDCLETDPNTLFQDSFRRGADVLTERERQLLEQYRSLSPLGRESVQTMVEALRACQQESAAPEQDLYRVNTLRALGYDPYVMIYERPTAPKITRHLQRWVNNKRIFHTVKDFKDYAPMKKEVH